MSQKHLTGSQLFDYANDRISKASKDAMDVHMKQCHLCFRRIRPYLKKAKEKPLSECNIFSPNDHSSTFTKCTACNDRVCTNHVKEIQTFFDENPNWLDVITNSSRTPRKGVICVDCALDIRLFDIEMVVQVLGNKTIPPGKEFIAKLIWNISEPILSKGAQKFN